MKESYLFKVSPSKEGYKVVVTDQVCRSSYFDISGDSNLSRIIAVVKSDGPGEYSIVSSSCSRKRSSFFKKPEIISWSLYKGKYYSYDLDFGQFVITEKKDNECHKLALELKNGSSFLILKGDSVDILKKTAERVLPFIRKSYELFNLKNVKRNISTSINWRIGKGILKTEKFYFGYIRIEDVYSRKKFLFDISVVFPTGAVFFDSFHVLNEAVSMVEVLVRVFYSF